MTLTRRQFGKRTAAIAGMSAIAPFSKAFASRNDQMNILCWEGYNSDEVLGPLGQLIQEQLLEQKVVHLTLI